MQIRNKLFSKDQYQFHQDVLIML